MTQDTRPPHARLIQMGFGYRVSAMLHAAAHYRLADHLADGPKTAEELAALTTTQPLALYRLMRTLADAGVFAEDEDARFTLTELGGALRSDAPGAARATLLFTIGEQHWLAWEKLVDTLADGEPGIDKVYGETFFEHLRRHPAKMSLFNETMVGIHGDDAPTIAAAFDFSRFATIVDVGGGTGNRLVAILTRHAGVSGLLFDQPHVINEARALYDGGALGTRLAFAAGSFFDAVPEGGDAYVLSHIIHDWPRDKALAILRAVRAAMTPGARLLLIEMVLPGGPAPHPGKALDMTMMVMLGGQERTREEYAELLAEAGFRLLDVTPTGTPASVVEAELA